MVVIVDELASGVLLLANATSPLYVAVNTWVPTFNAVVVYVAVPFTSALVPRAVDPSMKVTVPPVGVVVLGGSTVTVAVSTSEWP